MKNRLYAITLLLSFLVVLSHEMITHHHHDVKVLNFSVSSEHEDDHQHKHHQEDGHKHHHDSEKEENKTEHNHPFPFHQHISATNDVYIERTNLLESNNQLRDVSLLVYTELYRIEIYKPPKLEGKLYKESPFLISSLSYLEAYALRGPPAIV